MIVSVLFSRVGVAADVSASVGANISANHGGSASVGPRDRASIDGILGVSV